LVISSSHAVFAACHYCKLHRPETAAAPFPGDTIFAGSALDVAKRRQNVSMAVLMAMLSGHFYNQRPFLPDRTPPPGIYAASAKGGFRKAVRLKRT
jgi:hypothetical protein